MLSGLASTCPVRSLCCETQAKSDCCGHLGTAYSVSLDSTAVHGWKGKKEEVGGSHPGPGPRLLLHRPVRTRLPAPRQACRPRSSCPWPLLLVITPADLHVHHARLGGGGEEPAPALCGRYALAPVPPTHHHPSPAQHSSPRSGSTPPARPEQQRWGAFLVLKNADGMGDADGTTTAGQWLSCSPFHLLQPTPTFRLGTLLANIFFPPPLLLLLRHPPFIHPLPLLSSDTSILPTRHLLFFFTRKKREGRGEFYPVPSHLSYWARQLPPQPSSTPPRTKELEPAAAAVPRLRPRADFQHRTHRKKIKEGQDRALRILVERLHRA